MVCMEILPAAGPYVFLLWLAFCFAKLEIAIEGSDGWAGNLPTWRSEKTLSTIIAGGHVLTGYHLWANLFVVSTLHFVYVFTPFALRTELFIFSFYFAFVLIEDFLWFALNPAYGLRNFSKEMIWWHADHWWLFAPRDYYVFAVISAVLYYLAAQS